MLIKVKVYPESNEDQITRKSADAFSVKVKEKAENGEANRKVKQLIAAYFKVPPGKILLLKGGKKPNKIFEIRE